MPAQQSALHGNFTLDEVPGTSIWFIEAAGRTVSNRHPGAIFYAIPCFAVFGGDGFSMGPAAIAAASTATAAMAVLYLLLRRLVSPAAALLAAFVAGLATSTWSVSADALWNHGPNQLWLGLAMLGLASERYLASGLGFAAALFTRPHTGVIAAVAGLHRAWCARSLRPAIGIAATTALGLAAFLWYGYALYGRASATGGYTSYPIDGLTSLPLLRWAENIAGTLVAPNRGILVLSPFLLVLLPGLRAAWRAAPPWVRSAALGGVAYMLVQLRANYFDGGLSFFSYRLPIEMLTMAAPLLVLAYREWVARRPRWTQAFWTLVSLSVAIQTVGALTDELTYREGMRKIGWLTVEWGQAVDELGLGLIVALLAGSLLVWPLYGMARDARPAPVPDTPTPDPEPDPVRETVTP